jgi:hypothetical protein
MHVPLAYYWVSKEGRERMIRGATVSGIKDTARSDAYTVSTPSEAMGTSGFRMQSCLVPLNVELNFSEPLLGAFAPRRDASAEEKFKYEY